MSGYGCPDSRELLENWKAGKIMTEQKFGSSLGRWRLRGIRCAEKNQPHHLSKLNGVRLFKV
jgi:hypothetical protein